AELHRGDEARRVAGDPQDEPGAPVALVLELHDPRAPGGDEPVLGRHEERVQQDQPEKGKKLEREGHLAAPLAGARVLGGRSSSTRISRRSIPGPSAKRTPVLSSRGGRRVPGG